MTVSCVRYVMSPPIRPSGHDKALQAALSTGILQVIITKKMEHLQFLLLKMPDKSTFIMLSCKFQNASIYSFNFGFLL